jgi:ABC-type bacteriocin/lantibiotic exporter with double-glycine peptidase domain
MSTAWLRLIRIPAIAILPFVLAGCALLPRAPHRPHEADLRLDVPAISQKDPRQCGVAAVEMVSRYYGRELDDPALRELTAASEKQGALSGADLARALRASGHYVALFRGTMDATATGLHYNLARGRPLIVMLQHEVKDRALQHYVVLTGYDATSGAWLVADPQWGRLSIDAEAFQEAWGGASHFTLLAIPETRDRTTTKGEPHHVPAGN